MSDAQVGVFPLGPAPKMRSEIYRQRQIIKALCGLLQTIRYEINTTEATERTWGKFWPLINTGKCVICGIDGDKANDLDTAFCSKHCIICHGWEACLDV